MPSRFFAATTSTNGTILVPSSSPPSSESPFTNQSIPYQSDFSDGIPGLTHSRSAQLPVYHNDALTSSSGFVSSSDAVNASNLWELSPNGRSVSGTNDTEDLRSRSHAYRETSPKDSLDLITTPDSPAVQRPGQRKRVAGALAFSMSSDESSSDIKEMIAGPSKPRILRGRVDETKSSPPDPPQPEPEDPRLTRFKITQPFHSHPVVEAAWRQADGDVIKATRLLSDPSYKPPSTPTRPPTAEKRSETGRVEEVDEATKAQRAAAREKGKKSRIYNHRPPAEGPAYRLPSPPRRSSVDVTTSPEKAVNSPPPQPRIKRVKRKLVESDSEPEFVDDSDNDESSSRARRPTTVSSAESKALDYFANASPEALQELTGNSIIRDVSLALTPIQVVLPNKPRKSLNSDLMLQYLISTPN